MPRIVAVDIAAVIDLLERYGYVIVFIAGIAEATPLLGMLVPGQAIILLAGAASATGILKFWLVIAVALPAGILGDAGGYYLGRYYGRDFLEKYGKRFRIGDQQLARIDALFQKYGPVALVFARFSFVTRGIGPLMVGISGMRARTFWVYNVLGGIAWAVGYTVIGYFFGAAFLKLEGVFGRILTWTFLGAVSVYLLYRLLRKYAAAFTRGDFYVAMAAIAGATVFGVIADRLDKRGTANVIDRSEPWFTEQLAPLQPLFNVFDPLGSYVALGLVTLVLLGYLAYKGRAWEATLCGMGMGGILLLVETLRPIFELGLADSLTRATYPSADAAVSLVFVGIIAYLVIAHNTRWQVRAGTLAAGALFAAGVGLAPLARGLEMPTDMMGGYALGLAWLMVSILVVEFGVKR